MPENRTHSSKPQTLHELLSSPVFKNSTSETKNGLFHVWQINDFHHLTQDADPDTRKQWMGEAQDMFEKHADIPDEGVGQSLQDAGVNLLSGVPQAFNLVAEAGQQAAGLVSSGLDTLQQGIANVLPDGSEAQKFVLDDLEGAKQKKANINEAFETHVQGNITEGHDYARSLRSDYAHGRDRRFNEMLSQSDGTILGDAKQALKFYLENPGQAVQHALGSAATIATAGGAAAKLSQGATTLQATINAALIEGALGGAESSHQITTEITQPLLALGVDPLTASQIAQEAAQTAFVVGGGLSTLTGGIGVTGSLARGVSGKAKVDAASKAITDSTLKKALRVTGGTGIAVAGEGLQGAASQIGSNIGGSQVGLNIDVFDDVGSAAVQEAVAAAPFAGTVSALQARTPIEPPLAEQALQNSPTSHTQHTPSVDINPDDFVSPADVVSSETQVAPSDLPVGIIQPLPEVPVNPEIIEPQQLDLFEAQQIPETQSNPEIIEPQQIPDQPVVPKTIEQLQTITPLAPETVKSRKTQARKVLNELTVDELKPILENINLPTAGSKRTLANRAVDLAVLSDMTRDASTGAFIASSMEEFNTLLEVNKSYRKQVVNQAKKVLPKRQHKELTENPMDVLSPLVEQLHAVQDADTNTDSITSRAIEIIDSGEVVNLDQITTQLSPQIDAEQAQNTSQQATGKTQSTPTIRAEQAQNASQNASQKPLQQLIQKNLKGNLPARVWESHSFIPFDDLPGDLQNTWKNKVSQSRQTQQLDNTLAGDAQQIIADYLSSPRLKRLTAVAKTYGIPKREVINAIQHNLC